MRIIDITWTNRINILTIICDCGETFHWQTNISLIVCPKCQNKEWWHGDADVWNLKHNVNYKVSKIELNESRR